MPVEALLWLFHGCSRLRGCPQQRKQVLALQCARKKWADIALRLSLRPQLPGSGGVVIIMEYLNFGSRSDQAELGRRLVQMHLATPAVRQSMQ